MSSLQLKVQVWSLERIQGWEHKFEVISVDMVLKTEKVVEITKGVSVDGEKRKYKN